MSLADRTSISMPSFTTVSSFLVLVFNVAQENIHEIWYMEVKKSVQGRFAYDSCVRNIMI
jgi:hypothetical protein